ARLQDARTLFRVLDQRAPGLHRIGMLAFRFAPQVEQRAAYIWILHPDRAVDIPRGGDAALATARLIGWQTALEQRIVGLLHLPGHNPVLHVDRPRATAGAVDPMRAAYHVVVLPAFAVELLPLALLRVDYVEYPAHLNLLGTFARGSSLPLGLNRAIQPGWNVPLNQPPWYGPVCWPLSSAMVRCKAPSAVVASATIGRHPPLRSRFCHLKPAIASRTTRPSAARPPSCHIACAGRSLTPACPTKATTLARSSVVSGCCAHTAFMVGVGVPATKASSPAAPP